MLLVGFVPLLYPLYVRTLLFQLPADLLSTFCLWNSAPPFIIALLAVFDHVDTRFTPLSCHVYNILDVRVVHCRHSSGNCLALSAWVSARDEFKLTPTRKTSGKVHPCGTRIGTTVWPWCLATTDPLEAGDRPGRKSRRTLRSTPGGGQPSATGRRPDRRPH
jgi:hypothetical protein